MRVLLTSAWPDLAVLALWGGNQWTGRLVFNSLSVSLPFQRNKTMQGLRLGAFSCLTVGQCIGERSKKGEDAGTGPH